MAVVDLQHLSAARLDGRLDTEAWRTAVDALGTAPEPEVWRRILDRGALVAGTALLLAGAVYLVAFNWQELGYLTKLGAVCSALVAAGGLGAWLGTQHLSGRLALGSAGVLVGPALVVYSQGYQAGIDPWPLFATWTLLLLPWAFAARLWGVWLLVFALVDVTLVTWWVQTVPLPDHDALWLPVAVATLDAALWLAWARWGDGRALSRVLGGAVFVALLAPALVWIAASADGFALETRAGLAAACALPVLFGIVQAVYWDRGRDLLQVAISLAALITLATAGLARGLHELGDLWVLWTFVLGVVLVLQALLAISWIRLGLTRRTSWETA